jgi:multidrug efflux pump
MSLSTPFILRPVATTLLAIGVAIAGIVAFNLLPVASLPKMDFPAIFVHAALPGASPEVMATSVASPLERQLGRIAGITEMTSSSKLGSASVVALFDLSRDINGAARDVQAAINASLGQMPANLAGNPEYRKINPSESPILIITLTSDTYDIGKLYDLASNTLQQKLSQVSGVGQVQIGGSSFPAVRVEVNPKALNKYNLNFQTIAQIVAATNVNGPRGQLTMGDKSSEIVLANGQLFAVEDYKALIIAYKDGAAIRLNDVAAVSQSVEDVLNSGLSNNKPAVVLIVFKEPGANIIKTVASIKKMLPILQQTIPADIELKMILDRTITIKSSLDEVKLTLWLAIVLVVGVVYLFLGNARAALIPSVAVPLSLCGTFVVMYFLDFSLNNLSLIALTVATGFVVDDAVVVLENISRHIEQGVKPLNAALQGAKEVSFTVLSMSISLIAVFIPILLMGGIVGRLFREFAVTLSVAIMVSLVISLTVTPMMCSLLLKKNSHTEQATSFALKISSWLNNFYARTLNLALDYPKVIIALVFLSIILTGVMFYIVPKGFFPQQDTGAISCMIQSDQNMSFKELRTKLVAYLKIASEDPAASNVAGFVSDSGSGGFMFITLKDLATRKISADKVINRLRPQFANIAGSNIYMQVPQDIVMGGRKSSSQFQYTLSGENMPVLREWAPKVMSELVKIPGMTDINSDQSDNGLQVLVKINHDLAARYGISSKQIDDELYGAFGQKTISRLFANKDQYHVIMTIADKYWRDPSVLDEITLKSAAGEQIPLSTLASFEVSSASLSVQHQSQFPAINLSFNLLPGVAIGEITAKIDSVVKSMNLPSSIYGTFKGSAQAAQKALIDQLILIAVAILVVYLVLGILYENLIHPITILSTLPSAGVGALLALYITNIQITVIAIIGIILLVGIVKKNAIMMIDLAIYLKKHEHKSSREAIYESAQLRLRPIMMTTMAALLGALPLVLARGIGFELRLPLGVSIIGGLIVSQLLTLYTTPVIYLTLENFEQKCKQRWQSLWRTNENNYIKN